MIKASESIENDLQILNTKVKHVYDDFKKLSDKEELILFVSFDLVNSSSYKTSNYTTWFPVIISIIEKIKEQIVERIEKSQLWRTIGDEVVFIVNITEREQLEKSIQDVFEILNNTIKIIKDGTILNDKFSDDEIKVFIAQNALSLKSTAWIAPVNNTTYNFKKNTANIHNLMYMYNFNGEEGLPTYEFQGNDIDTGFRLSKHTRERRLTLSIELAYLLSENQLLDPKLNIVSYRSLKGIWNNKIYPIIWYHDEKVVNCKLLDSLFYDEYYNDDITKDYMDNVYDKVSFHHENTIFQKLRQIINDKNIMPKIEYIQNMLNQGDETNKIINANTMLEVHCVAVCYLPPDKVIMFRRDSNAAWFPDKWDFGCCQIRCGQSFKENLEKDYKEKYNIDIEILDPIKEYYFENDSHKIIPGVRFVAQIKDYSNIDIKDKEYSEYKEILINDFKELTIIEQKEYIDYEEFKEVITALDRYTFMNLYNKVDVNDENIKSKDVEKEGENQDESN